MKPVIYTLGLALLAGCAAAQPTLNQAPAAVEPTVTALAELDIREYADRRLMAPAVGLQPWKKADIHHARLTITPDGGSVAAELTVNQADINKQIKFNNLRRNTTYHVVAKAWSDSGETSQIDNGASDAASCTTDFSTTTNEVVSAGTLKLRLRDKVFAGTTNNAGLTVTDGAVTDTTATITATLVEI